MLNDIRDTLGPKFVSPLALAACHLKKGAFLQPKPVFVTLQSQKKVFPKSFLELSF
jgi:hypothetical protein